jgi:adenine-specific DNA-methyltransferase
MTTPEHLPLTSLDIAEERKAMLRKSFPEVFREDKIDFEALQRALGEWVDPGKERFGLNWPGKAACSKLIQQVSVGTLLPMREQSVDFDSTENLIIEGDNLEVLKLLQKSYYGKVKMIYIDPPYNTGNEFIYPDNFHEGLQDYLKYSAQVDDEGRKQSSNSETGGRYHSNWLSMMYPRLFLARNLLREDGVIFVSIDDNEVHNLRALMNEIFGEENFIDCIIWKKRYGGGAKEKYLVTVHEYVLMYGRNKSDVEDINVATSAESIERYYKDKDSNFELRGAYRTHPLEATKSMGERKNLVFEIPSPDGTPIMPKRQWLWGKERVVDALSKGEIAFLKDKDGNWSVHTKQYLKDESGNVRSSKAFSLIDDIYTQHGTNEILELFGDAQVFPFPKPSKFINKLLQVGTTTGDDCLVVDFFSGSGSTAHAVLEANKIDNGNRKFILVQLPEPTDNPAYPTIADITRERVRRVKAKLKAAQAVPDLLSDVTIAPDLGFKAMRLSSSNFKVWDGRADRMTDVGKSLKLFAEHVLPGRTSEDILYELLLKTGFPQTTPLSSLTLAGKQVFRAAEGALLICLEDALTLKVIEAMVALDPWLILCLDAGFSGQDQLKANAMQTVRAHNRNRQSSMSLKVV